MLNKNERMNKLNEMGINTGKYFTVALDNGTQVHLIIDENGNPKKWKVENSWGAASGHKGHLVMTNEWFNEYMFRLVVDKKYVPAEILELLKQEPTMLPPWDPMFADEL